MKSVFVRKLPAFMIFVGLGAASLSGVDIVPDARKIEPLARDTDEPAVVAAQEKVLGAPVRYASPFPVFIHLSEEDSDLPRKVRDLGGQASAVLPRLYAGAMPRDAARYVSNWPAVAYIEAGKRARPLLDASRPAVEADIVQFGGPGLPASYRGAGSFVGIVDTGLSRNHLDFYVDGQTASPRVAQWFPSQAAAGVDTEWHGTHVAGIAAGDGFSSGGLYTGMAPGARLLISRSTFLTTSIPTEIDAILNAAGSSPVAVNLSLGLMAGPHDGTSGFEQAVDSRAAGPPGSRRIIAVAAGNERNANEHFQVVLPAFGSTTAFLTIAPATATAPLLPMADIWADGGDRYSVTATISAGTTSVKTDAPPNGATHFEVFFNNNSTANASASVTIQRTRNGGTGRIDAYIDAVLFNNFLSNVFTTNAPAGTIIEPANGRNVIAAGSFNTKSGGNAGGVGSISGFSSLGPTRDGRRKPDVAAPGSVIYSAKSLDAYGGSGNPPQTVPGNDNYAILQGTSMAAPHVAGIAALVWESNPSLSGAQMRARLEETAELPAGVPSPDDTWGNGRVNALSAVTATVAGITVGFTPTPTAPTITPGMAVTIRADEKSSGPFGQAATYSWTATGGASVNPAAGSATTFVANTPGNYTVSLTATAGSPPAGTDEAVIHVNNIPTALITGPGATDNVIPVTFSGASSSDPDGQPLTFHWVLVSRPAGSTTTLSPIGGTDNAVLNPDVAGQYDIGLRADDGLDNSALAVLAFHAGGVAVSVGVGGGGGGCSVGGPGAGDAGAAAGTAVFLLAALAGSLALRRRVRRTSK